MVYISRLFITLTIALMLFGCAKEPTTLKCNIYNGTDRSIVIDFKENLFMVRFENSGEVKAGKLIISDDFYGFEYIGDNPSVLNRKTLEFKDWVEGQCSFTTFEKNELNDFITKGRSFWDKHKLSEINKI